MPFDKPTRNLLAKIVATCRDRLADDIAGQLQSLYGLYPDGASLDVAQTEDDRCAAEDLRALLAHFGAETAEAAAAGSAQARRTTAYQRLVREIGFTLLNRLAALRLCEQRGLLVECVRHGMGSDGFQLFDRIAGGALGNRYQTYRAFLENLFDELALDLGVLFDSSTPQSLVFPSEAALADILALLNDPELATRDVWQQDETIGWIYQYYNDPAERKAMRKASQAPRNSRELAVRNQFFTPRYVVEFLTDNTLGRTWYEMRQGHTRLTDQCRYLVRRPNEVFLKPGESPPPNPELDQNDAQSQIPNPQSPISNIQSPISNIQSPVYIPHRPQKDPRDLKILDPACGSGHFLLYAFDLLITIYEEAWNIPMMPPFSETGARLSDDYADLETLRRAVPGLILRHNLHGIDIDPRAVQIAALALWLRTQRAYQDLGLSPAERPRITKTNLVTAEPMPGDRELLDEFVRDLRPRVLGDLVRVVFEKMELAGEAGSLLKIEEELADAIAEAHRQWASESKAEQLALFPEDQRPKPEQLPLFDVSGITDEAFWETAEERVLEALRGYAARVENGQGTRRRLFAGDAARGFAFVDLCGKRFDVVLMNPPFGAAAKDAKNYIINAYPYTKNDIYASFVERGICKLKCGGALGAITSRTGFFLGTFQDWREKILLKKSQLIALADLGPDVLDGAVVEVATYVLQRTASHDRSAYFFRLLIEKNKEAALFSATSFQDTEQLFVVRPKSFGVIETSPFAYWLSEELRSSFGTFETFEPTVGDVRCGLSTGDNPRFVRALWEIRIPDTAFYYYPPNGELFCEFSDPVVQAYKAREQQGEQRWVPLVMAGAAQPWFAPFTVLVDWKANGRLIANYKGATIRSPLYYFRPGFSWTRRAIRMIPYVIPCGAIPTASRYMAYPKNGREATALGVIASNVTSGYLRMFGEKFEWPNFLVDNLKSMPWPEIGSDLSEELDQIVRSEVATRRDVYRGHEPFQEFTLPFGFRSVSAQHAVAFDYESLLENGIELKIADAFDLGKADLHSLERDLLEAVRSVRNTEESPQSNNESTDKSSESVVLDESPKSEWETNLSYFAGCAFGRWDIRIAADEGLAADLPDPFAPIPVCPPGMLISPNGLPATPGRIVSKAWLRARPNAITLPPEGSFEGPATIPDSEYPIPIAWDGILVDDPGLGEHPEPHPNDVVRRIREVLAVLWLENHAAIEAEACEILSVRELRDYFRKPSGFFADHLKRYSKSRRKAPIYWPLSTPSGSYTLWLYYHRFDDQILYTAVNRYVTPKIEQVEGHVTRLEANLSQASGHAATTLRDQLDETRALLAELREFRDELLRIAALPYKPDLNDGVIINAAPLHKLFCLRKWAKATEAVWKKLEAGEYDWAHLAYTLWPERVREVCKRDRSIAIAHGLEELCEVEEKGAKKKGKRRKKKPAAQEELLSYDSKMEEMANVKREAQP